MGLFDDIAEKAGAVFGDSDGMDSRLISVLMRIIQERFGGIGGLVRSFKAKGLGDIASSWVSASGDNRDISREDLERGLGRDTIQEAARESGLPEEETTSRLTALLPQIIDKLTPDGKMEGSLLDKGQEFLHGLEGNERGDEGERPSYRQP